MPFITLFDKPNLIESKLGLLFSTEKAFKVSLEYSYFCISIQIQINED